jgi:phosphatidylserine/phosphatidylglycerophosphate/cardiolipin synthase-like enzyme
MTSSSYLAAATVVPWLLADLERALENAVPDRIVDTAFVMNASAGRMPTGDEVTVAIRGLVDLDVLRSVPGGYRLDRDRLKNTKEYRRGFRDALATIDSTNDERITLCMALPAEIPSPIRQRMTDEAADLRSAIVNVVAAATHRLVLASPFWDVTTAADIGELARRRVAAGVRLDILGRSASTDDAIAFLNQLFDGIQSVRIFRWYQPQPAGDGITTFHFKSVIADDGARAYVGTANLTRSSLRSTMELGFIVGPRHGRPLARILDAVIAMSERVGPQ